MKKTTKMKLFRGISLMLCIIMMMQLTQLFVFAVGEDSPAAETNGEATPIENPPSENLFELGEGELPYAQLQELSPLDVALPETISRAQAIEKGHVNRLYAQEKTLQSVLYQNQNGTKTAYVFDKPVKYVRDGEVLDKDTTIRATGIAGYAYAMTENSFSAYFGSTAANGVMIQYEDHAFSMKPETSMLVSTPTLGEDAKTVVYNGAFGAQTALRYETQLSGVKEDIILMRNVGKYAFNFLLTTSGLTPVQQENGAWTLVNADQETVIDFGSIVIKDSAGKTVYGTLNITPRASGGYIMTVTVPQAFLQAANTVYPVYVDPTTVIMEKEYYIEQEGHIQNSTEYDAIYDMSVILGYSPLEYRPGQHILHTDAYARFVFSDFCLSYGQFFNLESSQINKATLYTTPRSCFYCTVKAAPMTESYNPYISEMPDVSYIYDAYYYDEITGEYLCNYDIFTKRDVALETSQDIWICGGEEGCLGTHCPQVTGLVPIDFTRIAKSWVRYNDGDSSNAHNPICGMAVYVDNYDYYYVDYISSTEASGSNDIYYVIDYDTAPEIYSIENSDYHQPLKMVVEDDDTYGTWLRRYKCVPGSFNALNIDWYITRSEDGNYHTISIIAEGVKKYLGQMSDGYFVYGMGYVDDPCLELVDTPVFWDIIPISSNQYMFRTQNGYYLYQDGSSLGLSYTLPNETASNYQAFLWNVEHAFHGITSDPYTISSILLPTSGSELPYNPDLWNCCEAVQDDTNCYGYALNCQINPKYDKLGFIHPGDYSNAYFSQYEGFRYADMILECVFADAEYANFSFYKIGRNEACPAGSYKVALVIDPPNNGNTDLGYHWYRQDASGFWSHKDGTNPATNIDASGNLIYDPEKADRDYTDVATSNHYNYSEFIGYYCVTPVNNLYTHVCN